MSTEPRKGLRLIEWSILGVIVLVICAVAIPGLMSSRRASNERNASTSLKTLSSAEADFRANDRDWNHVNDFWTGDVKGLYTMTSAEVRGAGTSPKDPPIRLIELSVASADVDDRLIAAGGENLPLSTFAVPSAKAGYWYAAMLLDLTLKDAEEATYKLDTGGTPAMGKCHNTSKFGFVAVPDSAWAGSYVFLVNENNTIFRQPLTGKPREGSKTPPGLDAVPREYLNWPDDSFWSRPN
jgi:hypothetical protein